jgi:nicotinate-nucleotide--dimethylbenzimidazole phosphoribosyltransferase
VLRKAAFYLKGYHSGEKSMIIPSSTFRIRLPDFSLKPALEEKINTRTKPLGSLGQLEQLALQIGLIQQTLNPMLKQPHLIVFAADHGAAESGISLYPQEVTRQMVLNFMARGAAINVFCRRHQIELDIVNAGVKGEALPVIDTRLPGTDGTRNYLQEPAMSLQQAAACLEKGATLVAGLATGACNVLGLGEMGIGNTASASLLMSRLTDIPVRECVGRGSGLDDAGLERKTRLLEQVLAFHAEAVSPLEILAAFGGFEIAQLCGAMLQAAQQNMVVLVDGFIASAAFLVAHAIEPNILPYAVFCHQSGEAGHRKLLEWLGVSPLLQLGMRLGEGTGCALAYPLLQSAVLFLNEMASFEQVGIERK